MKPTPILLLMLTIAMWCPAQALADPACPYDCTNPPPDRAADANKYPNGADHITCVSQNVQNPFNGNMANSPQVVREDWRIDRPYISTTPIDYCAIRVDAEDVVQINANGCAQTGGSGATWHLYRGDHDPRRKYFGTMNLPTITGDGVFQSIDHYANHPVVVALGGNLQLGYQDDNYSDNGYWGKITDPITNASTSQMRL